MKFFCLSSTVFRPGFATMPNTSPEIKLTQWLHRVTGVGVFMFLVLHIFHIWLAGFSPTTFDSLISIFTHPMFGVLNIFLFFCVLFHAINGLRVVLIDFIPALEKYRRGSVYVAAFLFFAVFIPSTLLILMDTFLADM